MKIALIGTGKMGMAVKERATLCGHEIMLSIDKLNRPAFSTEDLRQADMAIEFTQPDAVVDNLFWCLEAGVPVVSGTTGWNERAEEVYLKFKEKKGALLTATNFSIGVNIMFRLNKELSAWMNRYPEYISSIEEIHHSRKLDKPSGTALTLATDLIQACPRYQAWMLAQGNLSIQDDVLPVHSIREGEVVGMHEVSWTSEIDKISIQHEAFNRDGFAAGAVMAAEWLKGKSGVFSMQDVLFGKRNKQI